MKFGISVNANQSLKNTVEMAILAEAHGMDQVWVSDSPIQLYGPVVAGAIASRTSKIRIGLGLMSPFLHTPSQILNSILTLWNAYGNRFELCIGVGDRRQLHQAGVSPGVDNVPSEVRAARVAISSGLRRAGVKTRVWLGAQGPGMLSIAHNFDGILLNYSKVQMIRWAIGRGRLRAGPAFKIGISAPSYIHTAPQPRMLERVKVASALVALGATYQVLRRMRLSEEVREFAKKVADVGSIEAASQHIPQDFVDAFSIAQHSENLHSYLCDLNGMGVSNVVFGYPQSYSSENLSELARALGPLLS